MSMLTSGLMGDNSGKSGLTAGNVGNSALGGLGAAFLQQPTNTTTSGSSNSSGNASQAGTGTTTRNLTPYQDQLQSPLFKLISGLMTNPQATIAPFQNQARENVNQNYSGIGDTLRKKFLSTGGGESGKFGDALIGSDVSRRSDLSKVDNDYSQLGAQLPITAAGLAQQFLGQNFGQTTTNSQVGNSTNQSQNQSTTTQNSGNPLLTGLGTFASLLGAFL